MRTPFGTTAGGQTAELITLDSGAARCSITTYGGALVTLEVPDRNGVPVDVTLGFNSLSDYERHSTYMGALIGRFANRIGGSRFTLNGAEYTLAANDGANHLHGGTRGFDKKIWTAEDVPNGVRLTLDSPHMDEGYPGELRVAVTYTLEGSALTLRYEAVSDRDTICNLTNHAYFNLGGHDAGNILEHVLQLYASGYTPVRDQQSIPTGELAPVEGTPLDFRTPTAIGARIDADFDQLKYGNGYDHNWIVDGDTGDLRPAAEAYCPETGIVMTVRTTSPAIQLYTGNFLNGDTGKGGAVYKKRDAFCLETQFYPDAINHPQFPQPILRAGEKWEHVTVYEFSARG